MGCISTNRVESYVWHSLAASDDAGLECAATRTTELRSELNKDQILQATELRERIIERRQQLRKEQIAKAQEMLRKLNERQATNAVN